MEDKMTLGEELWALVEKAQGYAYISDAVEEMSDEEVIEVARKAMIEAKLVVTLLELFLSIHDEEKEIALDKRAIRGRFLPCHRQ